VASRSERKGRPSRNWTEKVVRAGDALHYTIYFENVATATAPAQEVFNHRHADTDLDWTSLRFGEVAFGNIVIPVTIDDYQFTARQNVPDYRPVVTNTWWVDVSGELDPASGVVHWVCERSIRRPVNYLKMPLPASCRRKMGVGEARDMLAFSVKPKSNVSIGTQITNEASIVFDTNEPILTNRVWNIIDYVSDLAIDVFRSTTFNPTWRVDNIHYSTGQ